MEERVSGFRVRGSWDEVVAHGERIARALRESDFDEDALAEWDDWQPKAHEDLGEEVSERTVEKASLEQGAGERAGQAATENLERVSEHALERGNHAVDTTTRKAIHTLETAVYKRVMTRFAPYYVDNELVSATLRETTRLKDGDEFVFEMNIHHDQLKEKVSQRLDMVEAADRGDV